MALPVLAPTLQSSCTPSHDPALMLTDRPLLVGEEQERGRGFALRTRSGFVWRVEGQLTAEGPAAVVADPIAPTHDGIYG
jgi:hypothetical protein